MPTPTRFPLAHNWRMMLRDLGMNPADVLRRAQLPEDLLSRENASLEPEAYFRFWEAMAAEAGDPTFPITLANVVSVEAFDPPIFAALCSPNLVIAAERLRDYKRLIAPVYLDVELREDALALSFRWLDGSLVPPPVMIATEFTFFTKLVRTCTREHVVPVRVTSPTPPEPHAAYTAFLGITIESDDAVSIAFAREDAERPFLTANEGMWRAFEPELRRRLAELDHSATMRDRVHSALLEALPSGLTSMEAIAKKLAVSKRTLQRRLKEEETTFMHVLNQTREKLARHYLTRSTLTSTEIAFLLGYEEASSFFRAFHDWTGTTPETVRAQATA